jgi:hypothetical protein
VGLFRRSVLLVLVLAAVCLGLLVVAPAWGAALVVFVVFAAVGERAPETRVMPGRTDAEVRRPGASRFDRSPERVIPPSEEVQAEAWRRVREGRESRR